MKSLQDSLPKAEGGSKFPSDLLDPKEKQKKEYCLAYMKAGYRNYSTGSCLVNNTVRHDWIRKRAYADGNQDNRIYAERITKLRNPQNQPVSYNDLDQRLLKLIPKYVDIITSYLEKIDFDVFCDSIHPEASRERAEKKWRLWAEAQLNGFFRHMSEKSGIDLIDKNKELPKDMNELDLMMQYSFRLAEEMMMELGQQMVLNENDWKEQYKQILHDAVVLGVVYQSVYIDRISGRVKVRYEDPVNAILEDFHGHKGKMQRRGVIRRMTVSELMLKAGSQFTREQYFDIAKSACGRWGNPDSIGEYSEYYNTDKQYDMYDTWEDNVVYVMDYEWDTCDRIKYKKTEVYGNEMTFKVPFSEKLGTTERQRPDGTMYDEKVYATDIKTVYGGEWIIGTDYIYNYGKMRNIPRPNENPKECYGKFLFYRISNTSMLDRMLPYIDSMQLAWIRIQNLKARALVSGIVVYDDAFMNVIIDGKAKTQKELVEAGLQTGIWVVKRRSTVDDDYAGGSEPRPIEKFEGGIGNELTELMSSMAQDRVNLRDDTGINEFMDASTPDPNALVGIADAAMAGAQNAIYPLLSGVITQQESVCTVISLCLQLIVRNTGKLSGYAPALGSGTKLIEITSAIDKTKYDTPVMYGVRVAARATQEQKQRMLAFIDQAIANSQNPESGGIDPIDGIELSHMIQNGTNMKLILQLYAQRNKKRREELHKREMEKIETNNKGAKEAAIKAEEEKRKTEEFIKGLEADTYRRKTDEDIRKLREEWGLKNKHERVKGETKKEVERIDEDQY